MAGNGVRNSKTELKENDNSVRHLRTCDSELELAAWQRRYRPGQSYQRGLTKLITGFCRCYWAYRIRNLMKRAGKLPLISNKASALAGGGLGLLKSSAPLLICIVRLLFNVDVQEKTVCCRIVID